MLAYGKKEGEWRGEGILYHTSLGLHHHTTIHRHAISTTIKSPRTGHKTRLVAAHLPHHATLDVALQLLEEWGRTLPKGRAILGIHANETFYGGGRRATGTHCQRRGRVWGLHLPGQALDTPTYHPYNTAMQPRRLDCRRQAASDHDAVWVTLDGGPPPRRSTATWGLRRLVHNSQDLLAANPPPTAEDLHASIASVARAITTPGKRLRPLQGKPPAAGHAQGRAAPRPQ